MDLLMADSLPWLRGSQQRLHDSLLAGRLLCRSIGCGATPVSAERMVCVVPEKPP